MANTAKVSVTACIFQLFSGRKSGNASQIFLVTMSNKQNINCVSMTTHRRSFGKTRYSLTYHNSFLRVIIKQYWISQNKHSLSLMYMSRSCFGFISVHCF